jgi:hypothetical protein
MSEIMYEHNTVKDFAELTKEIEIEDYSELIGKKIARVRHLTYEEMDDVFGWSLPYVKREDTILIEFTDGTRTFVSADPEINGPGHLAVSLF